MELSIMANRAGGRRAVGAVVACVVAGLLSAAAAAQEGGERRGWQGRRPALQGSAGVSPGELQTMFDGYVLMQAQEALQLSDQQFPRFVARLKALQAARRQARAERHRAILELRRMTLPRAATDEAQIRERLNRLSELDAASASAIATAAAAVDEVLDARQQARFRVFEESMEQRKVELLMRARQRR
jgi:hypothetical protein